MSLDEISMQCVEGDGESDESSKETNRSKPPLVNGRKNWKKLNLLILLMILLLLKT